MFVPNLTKAKGCSHDKGKAAVVKVVESQAELYSLDKNEDASLGKLQADGRITAEQAKSYKSIMSKQIRVSQLQIRAFTMLESFIGLRNSQPVSLGFVKFSSINFCSCGRANFLYGV